MSSESGAMLASVIVTCQTLVWTLGRAVWDSDDAMAGSDRDWLACREAAWAEASRADRARAAATISVLNTRETGRRLRRVMGDFRPNRSIAHGRRGRRPSLNQPARSTCRRGLPTPRPVRLIVLWSSREGMGAVGEHLKGWPAQARDVVKRMGANL